MNNSSEINKTTADGERPVAEIAQAAAAHKRWQRGMFIFRAIEVRLRFIGLFVAIGLLMVYWPTLENYWDRWTRPAAHAAASDAGSEYYCPMHPTVVRPGLEANGAVPNCPICGMPLSKRQKGAAPTLPTGVTSRVQLSPERIRLAGIETAAASYQPLMREVRAVGYVTYDERRQTEIVTRTAGYLEKLHVNSTYANVERGQPLAEIYSPALYSGIQELRLAQKHRSADLVASSRQRLRLLGVSDREIDDVLADESDRARLLIRSPQSGQVVQKNVVEGASVDAGSTLFKVADLSEVWIEADVYERDLSLLEVGQAVEATAEAYPGQTFRGTIAVIYPELNEQTRTGRIRVALPNDDLRLRPGMFATVLVKTPVREIEPFRSQVLAESRPSTDDVNTLMVWQKTCPVTGLELGSMGPPLKVELGEQTVLICCKSCEQSLRENPGQFLQRFEPVPEGAVLSIPASAVIDTGRKQIVYVEREPGLFEGVEVQLGPRMGDHYPVVAGLAPGDKIAAAGAFLLDAETRLNPAAASAYFGASGHAPGESAPPAATPPGHQH
jgi:Cu(I)/Ag(I) efflux system membrane fusion protein